MLEDTIILVALGILLLALIWLLARLLGTMSMQRQWVKGWGKLATQYGMTFNSGSTRCSITGMYRGRIIYLLGTFRTGIVLQMTTDNYTSNTLSMKANNLPLTLHNPDGETLFSQGFTLASGSQDFLDRLFLDRALRERLAPLARIPGLVINLSGEELSLSTPHLYLQGEELLRFLDALSELAAGMEGIRSANEAIS